jgi:hypothetical protein
MEVETEESSQQGIAELLSKVDENGGSLGTPWRA